MAQPKSMQQRRDELMDAIRDVLARELMKLGESPNEALFNACDITDRLAQYWAGSVICFPKDHRRKLQSRENEIYSKFNGRNVPELAMQYDMTERGMYKLIARVRKRMREGA